MKRVYVFFLLVALFVPQLSAATVFSLNPSDPNVTGTLVVTSAFDLFAFDARGNEFVAVVDTVAGPLGTILFGEGLWGSPAFPNTILYCTDLTNVIQHGIDTSSLTFGAGFITIQSSPTAVAGTPGPALAGFDQTLELTFAITGQQTGDDGNTAFSLALSGIEAAGPAIPEPATGFCTVAGILACALLFRKRR